MEKVYIYINLPIILYITSVRWGDMKKIILESDDWFDEENIYSEDARELLLEEDELSPEEEAFMRGYDEAG